jgi:FxsC-like protein
MIEGKDARKSPAGRPSYFYLSYAHSPPLAGSPPTPPDEWVRTFFGDLTSAVQDHASQQFRISPGFYDQEIWPSPNWKAALTDALGSAEVFVPLYSPAYLARSLPGREWVCFEERLIAAGIAEPLGRFTPVLWIPLPAGQQPPGWREARDLAPAPAASAYVENGLQTLLRLAPYRRYYDLIVDRLAERIVELAEKAPIEPSAVQDIDAVRSAFAFESQGLTFAVVVAAPTMGAIQAERNATATYGSVGSAWRPFATEQEQPLAQYASMAGEQFDFAVQVMELEMVGDLIDHAPGVILVDPWYISDDKGLNVFREFARRRPSWVLPVLISGSDHDERAAKLTQQMISLLGNDRIPRSGPARRALLGVERLQDFVALMPFLVAEAEREYLRHGPIPGSAAKSGSRLRLAVGGHSAQHDRSSSHEEKSDG